MRPFKPYLARFIKGASPHTGEEEKYVFSTTSECGEAGERTPPVWILEWLCAGNRGKQELTESNRGTKR